jgi:hypothetical protein
MNLIDCIEQLGEALQDAGAARTFVSIQVDRDADVDRIHSLLGKLVGGARTDLLPTDTHYDGHRWRQSRTTIAGVEVTLHSPHVAIEKAKAA